MTILSLIAIVKEARLVPAVVPAVLGLVEALDHYSQGMGCNVRCRYLRTKYHSGGRSYSYK